MKLIFVRHGETYHNIRGIIRGQSNSGLARLTPKGIGQAKALALRLKKEKIDAIFSSDLFRTRQTAKEIAKYHKHIPVKYDKLLRERKFGKLEGTSSAKFRELREKSGLPKHLFRPSGGENFSDVLKRAKKFIFKIYPKYKDKTVLLVTHGGFNRAMVCFLAKKPLKNIFDFNQENTCVNIGEISGPRKKLKTKIHRMNCIRHL